MNLAGVGGDVGASDVVFKQHKRTYRVPVHH
jgi:hypothetical protein